MGILHNDRLRTVIPDSVDPFDVNVIDDAHYELSLGNQYYTTASADGLRIDIPTGKSIAIKPGQFALLITKETIKIPPNIVALISIKASVKFKGLINISGFHVDPGFHGRLKFAVYNAGTKDIVLDWEQRLFPMWFCELTGDNPLYDGDHNRQSSITGKDIEAIKGDVISPNILLEKFKELESRIGNLRVGIAIAITIVVSVLGVGLGKLVDANLMNSLIDGADRQTKVETNMNGLGNAISNQQLGLKELESRIGRLETANANRNTRR